MVTFGWCDVILSKNDLLLAENSKTTNDFVLNERQTYSSHCVC